MLPNVLSRNRPVRCRSMVALTHLPRFTNKSLHIGMAILLCLVAIIIWSPLHKHQNGKCSLNNLESFVSGKVAAEVALPAPAKSHFLALVVNAVVALAMAPRDLPARAPPAQLT